MTVGFAGIGRMGLAMAGNALAENLAAGLGVRLPAAAAASAVLEEALRNDLADADIASVIGLLEPTDDLTEET
jgi:3-hydroxyisobutyrate dehydrogenase-like beta-hydroxyacid dehydrogenase